MRAQDRPPASVVRRASLSPQASNALRCARAGIGHCFFVAIVIACIAMGPGSLRWGFFVVVSWSSLWLCACDEKRAAPPANPTAVRPVLETWDAGSAVASWDAGRAAPPSSPGSTSASSAQDQGRCTRDEDCTFAPRDCCGCTAGGGRVAIRVDEVEAQTQALHCEPAQPCPAVMSDTLECLADRAFCQNGRCAADPRGPRYLQHQRSLELYEQERRKQQPMPR
jgi:hypothetical protein